MQTKVENVRNIPRGSNGTIYIGRPSKWGNPFKMRDPSLSERERVIAAYKKRLRLFLRTKRFTKTDLRPLLGKKLLCYCHPLPCHGDVLVEVLRELFPRAFLPRRKRTQFVTKYKTRLRRRN